MEKLWAPWRMRYLTLPVNKGCIFCRAAKKQDKKSFVVFTTKYSLVLLNIFPYNNGHCLVAPLRHVRSLNQLRDQEMLDIFKTVRKTQQLLAKIVKPHGFNIGINISKDAGAGIPGHLHIHIVPRWKGDTNFMPVIANTKIISQSLNDLLTKLHHAYRTTA